MITENETISFCDIDKYNSLPLMNLLH